MIAPRTPPAVRDVGGEPVILPDRVERRRTDLDPAGMRALAELAVRHRERVLGLERAVRLIRACTGERRRATLVVEWIPNDDEQLQSLYDNELHRSPQLRRYSLDALRALLGSEWHVTTTAIPESRRSLLHCKRSG